MEKPKNLRADLWQRFKKLEKRADDLAEKNKIKQENYTKRKKKKENELAAQLTEKLSEEKNEVEKKKEDPSLTEKSSEEKDEEDPSSSSTEASDSKVEEWQDVKQYLNINNHLETPAASSSAPKSGLEIKIHEAISTGDIDTAASLSDQLATREFGTKIAASFDAREYLKRKKEEEITAKAKKKKKLHWGVSNGRNV